MNTIKLLIPEKKFKKLAKEVDFYCVSIYLSLNNLDNQLESRKTLIAKQKQLKKILKKEKITGNRASNYLNPIQQLLDTGNIWSKNSGGLIIFINEKINYYSLIEHNIGNEIYLTSTFYLLPLFKKIPKEKIKKGFEKISTTVSSKNIITDRIDKIIPLAFEGKIDTLYVSSKNDIYGIYDHNNKTIIIDENKNPTSMSLLNLAATKTYLNNGKVYIAKPANMPVKGISLQAVLK